MRAASLLALVCVALLATVAVAHGDHGAHSDNGDVVVLTGATFDDAIKGSDLSLVEFFAPWCGHCKTLGPNFARASTELKGVAQLASVDCTVEKDLCSRYGVQGFPTLKIFKASGDIEKPSDYQGGRTDKDIVKHIRKQTEPSYITVSTAAELTSLRARDGTEVVGVFESVDSAEAKAFIALAEELRNDYTFAISTAAAIATENGASVPALLLFKGDADTAASVSDAAATASTEAAKAWVQAEAFELVGEIGPENFQKYLDRGLPLVWCFLDFSADKAAATKDILKQIEAAAATQKGKLSIVKLDGGRWAEHAKHFGLSGTKLPGIVIEDRANNKNFIFNEQSEVTSAALGAHLASFLKGELKANTKSQAEPTEKWTAGNVQVLVGTSFERIVTQDTTKDVFVKFYAPWCGHCKTLAPKWETLAEEFSGDSNIVIAKVDSTENDTPAKIEGFPTLIFYPAGDKKPITFEGDRSVEAMAKFVKDNRKSTATTDAAEEATPAATEAATEVNHEEL